MAGCIKISALVLIFFVCASYERPQFNLGSIFTNGIGAAFNTAIGRDCKGRAQGDYFYGCQCVGPFNIGKRSAEPVDNRLFINSNQGFGGDFVRCSVATVLNRNQGWRMWEMPFTLLLNHDSWYCYSILYGLDCFFKFAYMGKFRWPYRSVPILLPTLDQTSSIGWTQPHPQPQPQPSQAALVEDEVEVEAQPTGLGRLRLRLRLRHSLPG